MFFLAFGCATGCLFSGQFVFSRIDLYQRRIRWIQHKNTWKQDFSPAYTLAALDVRHDLLHCFDVEIGSNKLFKAQWSLDENNCNGVQKEEYKKKLYSELQRWFSTLSRDELQCDIQNVDELIAWSQVNDM